MECENLPICGCIKKYQDSKSMACRGFILQYCRGPKQEHCQRKAYKKEHGRPASDDMLPSGHMITAGQE